MNAATTRPAALRPAPDLVPPLRSRTVGPGWEVLLMPEPLAQRVTAAAARSTTTPVGWVFAHDDHWGILLPEGSGDPAWPSGTTYLPVGASVVLPPFTWRRPRHRSGWVSQDGPMISRPLPVHHLVTQLAAEPASPRTGALAMSTTCPAPSPRAGAQPDGTPVRDEPERRCAEEVLGLDLQVAEVPGTAGALAHFFLDP
ncbi:hypothetical protein [Streptomyces sp. NPDC092952]|uniref:hypothetical protein n=1 Tax=Streptomyces sp. NPDC092952 TaxID=3366018 RepID=UPI0038118ED6